MKIEKFERNPLFVDAVQVTESNMEEVAKWCNGEIRTKAPNDKYIKVRVRQGVVKNQSPSQAFVGDWILFSSEFRGYKVYTDKIFKRSFSSVFRDQNVNEVLLRREAAGEV